VSALLYGAFVVAQTVRAKREEAKLESVFPEYGAYKARTGRFWPATG
jgi:protein-S-isoprenylcysteine O-methyltransferase Ste14